MPATSRKQVVKRTACPGCGRSVRVRVDGSIARHDYRRNGKVIVCPAGDQEKRKLERSVVMENPECGQEFHHQRVSRLLAWIGRQPGYRATARGDHFLVVGPRPDRKPARIPRMTCGDQAWRGVLADLYRLGLIRVGSVNARPTAPTTATPRRPHRLGLTTVESAGRRPATTAPPRRDATSRP